MRQQDWLEIVTPTPPGAMTLPTSSKKYRRTVEVDFQDRLDGRLTGRHTRSVDEHLDLAVLLPPAMRGLNGLAAREVHLDGRDIEARLVHRFGDSLRIL